MSLNRMWARAGEAVATAALGTFVAVGCIVFYVCVWSIGYSMARKDKP